MGGSVGLCRALVRGSYPRGGAEQCLGQFPESGAAGYDTGAGFLAVFPGPERWVAIQRE